MGGRRDGRCAVCVPAVSRVCRAVVWLCRAVVLRGVTRCRALRGVVAVVLPWRLRGSVVSLRCVPTVPVALSCGCAVALRSAYVRSPSMVVPFVTVSFGSCDVCGTIGDCRDSRWRE